MMAAHVADITAVSSCKVKEGGAGGERNQLLSAPSGPHRQGKKRNLIIKLSKAFLVSVFFFLVLNVFECVAVGRVFSLLGGHQVSKCI